MAEVYQRKAKQIARMVKPVCRQAAEDIAVKSRAILATHHDKGNKGKGTRPRIIVRSGRIDSYVILEDPDGGALAIEYGRAGGVTQDGRTVGTMEPIAPLRGAL